VSEAVKLTESRQSGDSDLFARLRAGDEEAFTLLYTRRQGGIFRFALLMTGSRETAEDVTQEVFLAVIKDGGRFDPGRGSFPAYLYGIARKKLFRHLRERPVEAGVEPGTTEGPLDHLVRNETIQMVWDAVLRLPVHYREAVVLCELHEMSYEEASAALGCSVGTVRSRLHRGRALLGERLKAAGSIA
jgi:RNA polymerase sigma-70 factor (ECF subfamily)